MFFDLYPVSHMVADSALLMGGSNILWYRAEFCPYIREDGRPCFDEKSGNAYIECPVCVGKGTVWGQPRSIRGVYTDKSNEFIPDGMGGFMKGRKTLSLSPNLPIKLLKHRDEKVARRLLRDKFILLERDCHGRMKHKETVFAAADPVKPTINSGTIYLILEVETNL